MHYNFLPTSFMLNFLRIVFKVLAVNDQTLHICHIIMKYIYMCHNIMKNIYIFCMVKIYLFLVLFAYIFEQILLQSVIDVDANFLKVFKTVCFRLIEALKWYFMTILFYNSCTC